MNSGGSKMTGIGWHLPIPHLTNLRHPYRENPFTKQFHNVVLSDLSIRNRVGLSLLEHKLLRSTHWKDNGTNLGVRNFDYPEFGRKSTYLIQLT